MKLRTLAFAALFATACNEEPGGEPAADATAKSAGAKEPGAEKAATKTEPVAAADLSPPSDVAAAPADATKTETGLAYKVLTAGSGENPAAEDVVEVHYTGWTTDGESFDSSYKRNKPAKFPLNKVIAGWTEGLQLMCPGETTRFWIPVDLAYKGRPGAPAGMLVFDVELISIQEPPPPIPAPDDVAAAPASAKTTESGLAWVELQSAEGARPSATDRVRVHYTGWTTDGEMFDSSVQRGRPAVFPLNKVIAGWTEGLQLLNVGEKARFWIPEDLAYKGRPGAPSGMLVFDVELLEILPPPKPRIDVKTAPKTPKATETGGE